MSEDNIEKRRMKKEYGMEMGRILGVMAREDPELYTAIKEYAEKNNMEVTEAVSTLLKKQFLHQKLTYTNVSVDQLLVAWDILKDLIQYSTQLYTSMSTLFFSDMTRAYSELIEQKINEKLENVQTAPPMDSKLREKLMNIIEPMIDGLISMSMKGMGMNVPEQLKAKVPVKLEVTENSLEGEVKQ